MEENKKNNNVGLLVVLFVIIIGLAGFIVYQNFFDKKETKKEEKEIKEEKKDEQKEEELKGEAYDLSKAKELVDKYRFSYFCENFAKPESKDAYMAALLKVNGKKTNYYHEEFDENGNPKAVVYDEKKVVDGSISGEELIGYDEINSVYHSLYSGNMPKTNFNSYGVNFYWNEKDNNYIAISHNYGGYCADENMYAVKDAAIVNDKLIIQVYNVTIGENYESNTIETTLKNGDKKTFESMESAKKYFNDHTSEFGYLTFTFVKENNNYLLESIK